MTNKEKEIYINIRAEQIKHFQDTRNGHLFTKPYSIELAKQVAENQLNCDLERGELRITLEELLLNSNDETCISMIRSKQVEIAKKTINE